MAAQNSQPDFDTLIEALIIQESNGDDNAIGDNGKALGCLQIWEVVVKDANNFFKQNYTHQDMFNRKKAKNVCRMYLIQWGKNYTKVTKKQPTEEVLARIWNGGPKGYEKKATLKYWSSVQKILQTLKK